MSMDKSFMSEDPAGETTAKDTFESSCPYRQPGVDQGPLFRLIQTFDEYACTMIAR